MKSRQNQTIHGQSIFRQCNPWMCWLINQSSILTPITCRAGVQARVCGEGEGAGQVLAQARLHRHEIPLRLPTASLYLQVHLLSEAWSKVTCPLFQQLSLFDSLSFLPPAEVDWKTLPFPQISWQRSLSPPFSASKV